MRWYSKKGKAKGKVSKLGQLEAFPGRDAPGGRGSSEPPPAKEQAEPPTISKRKFTYDLPYADGTSLGYPSEGLEQHLEEIANNGNSLLASKIKHYHDDRLKPAIKRYSHVSRKVSEEREQLQEAFRSSQNRIAKLEEEDYAHQQNMYRKLLTDAEKSEDQLRAHEQSLSGLLADSHLRLAANENIPERIKKKKTDRRLNVFQRLGISNRKVAQEASERQSDPIEDVLLKGGHRMAGGEASLQFAQGFNIPATMEEACVAVGVPYYPYCELNLDTVEKLEKDLTHPELIRSFFSGEKTNLLSGIVKSWSIFLDRRPAMPLMPEAAYHMASWYVGISLGLSLGVAFKFLNIKQETDLADLLAPGDYILGMINLFWLIVSELNIIELDDAALKSAKESVQGLGRLFLVALSIMLGAYGAKLARYTVQNAFLKLGESFGAVKYRVALNTAANFGETL